MALLKVTSVPPGEAPDWVRAEWVGLSLPLADADGSIHTLETVGVLSQPTSRFTYLLARLFGRIKRESGYLVFCKEAIEVLQNSSPTAAAWWLSNTPWVTHPSATFMFQQGVGHVELSDAP